MLQQARENREGDLDYTWLNVDQFIRMERKNISNQFSIHFRKNTRPLHEYACTRDLQKKLNRIK